MMQQSDKLILFFSLVNVMLIWRCVPLFLLKGKTLSPKIKRALELIPVAAFSALVANDILAVDAFATGDFASALVPLLASVPVIPVAKKTGSLIGSAIVGMAAYALLSLAFGLL